MAFTAFNDRINANYKLGIIFMEVIVTCFLILSQAFIRGTEGTTQNLSQYRQFWGLKQIMETVECETVLHYIPQYCRTKSVYNTQFGYERFPTPHMFQFTIHCHHSYPS
jgi:hypothetical protein